MENVTAVLQPEHSLISEQSVLEGYVTNCLSGEVSKVVVLSDLIEAFYKTPLFRLGRLVLSLAPFGRLHDTDITALSKGRVDRIYVWQVEARLDTQILLSAGGTKPWLMFQPLDSGTRLCFGSVLVPRPSKVEGETPKVGWFLNSLIGARLIYS